MMVVCMVNGRSVVVEAVQENPKTVWVRLRDGMIVKRHRVKHVVETVVI